MNVARNWHELFVAEKVNDGPCPHGDQPCNDLVDGRVENQHVHLQHHREGGEIESHDGKKHE